MGIVDIATDEFKAEQIPMNESSELKVNNELLESLNGKKYWFYVVKMLKSKV